MNLKELAQTIRFDNASKGFDPTEGGVERYLLLTVSELCEAQNELRDGHSPTHIYYSTNAGYGEERNHGDSKPEGFPVELADAIIRVLDIQAKLELNIEIWRGAHRFDPGNTLDKELLAVVWSISRTVADKKYEYNLNLALNGMLQIAANLNIDILKVIDEKLAFNRSRPPKHGRKF